MVLFSYVCTKPQVKMPGWRWDRSRSLWRWAGDLRIGMLGGSIGLLQLMHPAIGSGVLDHSDFFRDPFDRIFRSLPPILGVVYDGAPAEQTGHDVRDFHRGIKGVDARGRSYHALEPSTFWWAHATFQYMAEQVADRFDDYQLSRPSASSSTPKEWSGTGATESAVAASPPTGRRSNGSGTRRVTGCSSEPKPSSSPSR